MTGSGQLIVGLQLHRGLTNTTRRTGQHVELRCSFKCIKNAAAEKCDIKPSNVKWTKNESPLKNQKNKIEIVFSRRKNDYKGKWWTPCCCAILFCLFNEICNLTKLVGEVVIIQTLKYSVEGFLGTKSVLLIAIKSCL